MKEVFSYTQDDLNTEEVLILDCYNEIYVWVGQHSSVSSKQQALTLGKVIAALASNLKGFSFCNDCDYCYLSMGIFLPINILYVYVCICSYVFNSFKLQFNSLDYHCTMYICCSPITLPVPNLLSFFSCNSQKYLESDILLGGLSLETAIYVITEGHEPSFFTRFFEWDSSKAFVSGSLLI